MRLKSISINGFKSFAERVNVQFHQGITGVIGPNGSGKSNIIDAVRWVMGEQAAKNLRADDPTDIIFAGSQNRKQLGMAEVQLTFSNDGSRCPPEFLHLPEISIGRRIFRDGTREYLINREPCRLKDIVDFLLAIGLGSRSYSIIQQEKRDRIIQATPDDMREIIEETAGITVYKVRRKEAEKRMESTRDRLRSLGEIERELTKQVEHLKDQVEKATQKKHLSEALHAKEVTLLANHVGFFRSLVKQLRDDIQKRTADVNSSVSEATGWEADANETKSRQLELMEEIRVLENRFDDKRLSLTKYQERQNQQHRVVDERQKQRAQLKSNLEEERENLAREELRQEQLQHEMESHEQALRRLDGQLEQLDARLEEIEETLSVERSRGEDLRHEIRAAQDLRRTLSTRNESLLDAIGKSNAQLQKVEIQLQQAHTQKERASVERLALAQELDSLSQGLDQISSRKSELDRELHQLEESSRLLKATRDQAREKRVALTGQLNALQKWIQSGGGQTDGARLLREKHAKSILGFVFESLGVPPREEALLEKALPGLLQAAYVKDADALVELLDHLEEGGEPPPLELLVQSLLQELSPEEAHFRETLLKKTGHRPLLISNSHEKASPGALLAQRILFVQEEWQAIAAMESSPLSAGFVFLTERGVAVSGLGRVFYGSGGEGHGLLQQKRELEELQKAKDESEEALASAEGQLFRHTEVRQNLEKEAQQLGETLSREKVDVLKKTSLLEQFDMQLLHAKENFDKSQTEKDALLAERDLNSQTYSRNQSEMDRLEKELRALERDLAEFEEGVTEQRELKEEISQQRQSLRSDRAVCQEKQSQSRRSYEEMRMGLQRVRERLDRTLGQLSDVEHLLEGTSQESTNLQKEIDILKSDVKDLEEQLNEKVNEEALVSEQLQVLENKLKSQKDAQSVKQKEISTKQVELARYDAILETALKDAWERFQLHPDHLPQSGEDEPIQRKLLENEIKDLQGQLAALGPVNERALEEYQDAKERLEFLLIQRADIETSAAELEKSILEIEHITQTRFKDMFDKVNGEFQQIFPILFPGGHGELHLLDANNLLTTGVEILVRLPGKKLQNMSLFSGGEKALTAISLIFSLLRLTPAPFCFLDEVDAPLDEANVGRFNAIIDRLSDQFQFVVITHNRRTMEVLDTIYGISMAEPGVSRLVAVDLSEVPSHLRKPQKPALRSGASAAAEAPASDSTPPT